MAAAAVVAHAYDTTWIKGNAVVFAMSLKDDLDEVQSRLAALEGKTRLVVTTDAGAYSVGALYCGSTPPQSGALGGYAGARVRFMQVERNRWKHL